MTIKADFIRATAEDSSAIAISTDNGMTWKDRLTKAERPAIGPCRLKLIERGQRPLRSARQGPALRQGRRLRRPAPLHPLRDHHPGQQQDPAEAQPRQEHRLRRRRRADRVHRPLARAAGRQVQDTTSSKSRTSSRPTGAPGLRRHVLQPTKAGEEAYVVFRIDAPQRHHPAHLRRAVLQPRPKSQIDFLHSFDGGKTWIKSWTLTDTTTPWDVIHYETVSHPRRHRARAVQVPHELPRRRRTGAVQHLRRAHGGQPQAGRRDIQADGSHLRLERAAGGLLHRRAQPHPARREAPVTYTINVGGADHPIVESLRPCSSHKPRADLKYGYSDGKDAGGEKFVGRWVTYGKNLATASPTPPPSPRQQLGRGRPRRQEAHRRHRRPAYVGGTAIQVRRLWTDRPSSPSSPSTSARARSAAPSASRSGGYPWWDAIKGEVKDKVEVAHLRRRQGVHQPRRLRLQPALEGHPRQPHVARRGGLLRPQLRADARQARRGPLRAVQAHAAPACLSVSEVQVYDTIDYAPFDLKLALPDGKDRSDITAYLPKHTPSKPYKPEGK